MKTSTICAETDLGVTVNGTSKGPGKIIDDINQIDPIIISTDPDYHKETDIQNHHKNETELNRYNDELYHSVLVKEEENYFPFLLGGDHSASIASVLADEEIHQDIGLIWLDAHTDYNTFETTETGNIHGLPLAAIDGYHNASLRTFHTGNIISPQHTVVVGARSIDQYELDNVHDAGVTVFSTQDVKQKGVKAILEQAFQIAGIGTHGIHVSFDVDLIDPILAPGVSVPAENGISMNECTEIVEFLCKKIEQITGFDLVEFNPCLDICHRTEDIVVNIAKKMLAAVSGKREVVL